MYKFRMLTETEKKSLSEEELKKYYKNLKEYYANSSDKVPYRLIRATNPLAVKLIKTQIKQEVSIINKDRLDYKQTIYVANHTNTYDVPIMTSVIDTSFFLLAGCEVKKCIGGLAFSLLGTTFVDRTSNEDRIRALEQMIKIINKGNNALIFPEGTWNRRQDEAVLPFRYGVVEMSKRTGVPVRPITFSYYDNDTKCIANIGDSISFDNDLSNQAKLRDYSILRDSMEELLKETWDKVPESSKKIISESEFRKLIIKRIKEYRLFIEDFEESLIYEPNEAPKEKAK